MLDDDEKGVIDPAIEMFVRDDRDDIDMTIKMLDTFGAMKILIDAVRQIETYGLSVTFNSTRLEYTCVDPLCRYSGVANTPTGAVLMWEAAARGIFGSNDVTR
jgi:hypothetical protein